MPIGKNAIKRVENNGYSNVKSSAPDMENSSVVVPVGPAEAEGTKETPAEEKVKAVSAKPTKKRGRPFKAAKAEPVSALEEKPAEAEVAKETLAGETVAAVSSKPTKKRGRPFKAAKAENVPAAEEKPAKTEKAPAKRAPRRTGKKAAVPAKPKTGKNGFERVEIGTEMPYWLL